MDNHGDHGMGLPDDNIDRAGACCVCFVWVLMLATFAFLMFR